MRIFKIVFCLALFTAQAVYADQNRLLFDYQPENLSVVQISNPGRKKVMTIKIDSSTTNTLKGMTLCWSIAHISNMDPMYGLEFRNAKTDEMLVGRGTGNTTPEGQVWPTQSMNKNFDPPLNLPMTIDVYFPAAYIQGISFLELLSFNINGKEVGAMPYKVILLFNSKEYDDSIRSLGKKKIPPPKIKTPPIKKYSKKPKGAMI